MKRATTTAAVGLADGTAPIVRAGETYPDDHPVAVERPELFVDVDQADEDKPTRRRRS